MHPLPAHVCLLLVVSLLAMGGALQAVAEEASTPEGDKPPMPVVIDVALSTLRQTGKAEVIIERRVGVYHGDNVVPVRFRFTNDTDAVVVIAPPKVSCACTATQKNAITLARRGDSAAQEVGWNIMFQHGGVGISVRFPLLITEGGGRQDKRELDVQLHARSSDAITAPDWTRLLRMGDIPLACGASGGGPAMVGNFRFQRGQYASDWDSVDVIELVPSFIKARTSIGGDGSLDIGFSCPDASSLPFIGYYTGTIVLGFRAKGVLKRTVKKGISGRITGPVRAVPATLYLGCLGNEGKGESGFRSKDVILDGMATIERCNLDPVLARYFAYRILPVDGTDRRLRIRIERLTGGKDAADSSAVDIAGDDGCYFKPGFEVCGTAADGTAIILRLMVVCNTGQARRGG